MNEFLNGVARAVAETFDLPGPILEVGSYLVPGQGDIANLRPLFPGKTYAGVDKRPGPGVDQMADVEALPYADGSFGTVIAMNTFEHVPRFWRGFEEVYRVLRRDGALFLSCPFYFHIHSHPSDYWRFTPEALELLLQDYPTRILGWHGPLKRPANVWALAFREGRPPVTSRQFERYRELVGRYARQPLPRRQRLRYQLGRWLCGRGPFAPHLDQGRWQTRLVGLTSDVTPDTGPGSPASELAAAETRRSSVRRSLTAQLTAWQQRQSDAEPIDVSVCIANWNCRDMLRACLESLHDQPQGVRVETIVADNASVDGAAGMVAREFPEVSLHRNTINVGFARANNQAALLARGRYLLFLNNDTVVPAGALGRLVDYADRHPEIGLLGPRLRDGAGRTQVSYRLRPTAATLLHRTSLLRWTGLLRRGYRHYRRQVFDPETTRPVEVLMGAAMLIPRQVFVECGGWDEDFTFGGEDMELSVRIGRQHQVVYHPGVEITHYGRTSTRQHIGFASSHMAIGFLHYLRKSGYSGPMLLAYKLVVTLDAPVQLVSKASQYLWRRLRGRRSKADKSLLAFRGLGHFLLKGLVPFWQA
jgi:GT2 family glycosyltransferase/SAM-dependent methyltransferase